MSIRKLPSGSYQARVTIDGVNHSGTFASKEEAADWLVVTRARSITGGLPKRVTVRDYAERWMTTYDEAPSSTRKWHQSNLDLYIVPALGHRRLSDVTPTDISRMLNAIRKSVSAAKADAVYRTCSALFNAAVADDVTSRSPVRSKKHRPRRQRPAQVVLERSQARDVLLQMRGWHRDVALLQMSLGARFGEIAALTPHDLDLGRRRITIARRYYDGTVRATKNHRFRTVDLPQVTLSTVERLCREAGDVEPIPPLDDREHDALQFIGRWLIQTSTGRPANHSAFTKALSKACSDAGAPRITSHGLRHTYVSWMIDKGYSAEQVAFWIGDTPATVHTVYAHMLEASSAPAAAEIDDALRDLA
ncbi:MAG: site-specific integrase [Actinobacteria bacterium]|nr:site-specific integrase [Actinomycetota bacterium]